MNYNERNNEDLTARAQRTLDGKMLLAFEPLNNDLKELLANKFNGNLLANEWTYIAAIPIDHFNQKLIQQINAYLQIHALYPVIDETVRYTLTHEPDNHDFYVELEIRRK